MMMVTFSPGDKNPRVLELTKIRGLVPLVLQMRELRPVTLSDFKCFFPQGAYDI